MERNRKVRSKWIDLHFAELSEEKKKILLENLRIEIKTALVDLIKEDLQRKPDLSCRQLAFKYGFGKSSIALILKSVRASSK